MAAGGAKSDDPQPFPVKEQLPGVDFCISTSPPWPEALLHGFQHYLVMLGTTVIISSTIVPLMGGGYEEKAEVINTLLFVSGINTLMQTFLGTRLPVVIGGSNAFMISTISIALSTSDSSVLVNPQQRFKESMRDVQGALIVASFFTMVIGFFGFWRVFIRFFSPLATAPLVILTGLGLYANGFPHLSRCIEIGLPALIAVVFLSQYSPRLLKSKGAMLDRFAILFSVAIIWVYGEILTAAGVYDNRSPKTQFSCRTDQSGLIGPAPWIRIPYPFQWGRPSFNAGHAVAAIAASFVSIIESTGTFIAASRYASATPMPPFVHSRGVGWLGVGLLLNGLFGTGIGSTASVENAGLLGLTRVGSRRVIHLSALFMLFFSVFGKFGAVMASVPLPIVAALHCVLFAYVASAGLGLLQFCNLNSFRTKFILGFSLFLGLSIPRYFNDYLLVSGHGPVHTPSTWFNNVMQVMFSSSATLAIVVAFFLDCTLGYGDTSVGRDNGSQWYEKFRNFNADSRTECFYALPGNLSRFFPSY
ncbi:Nucleobase-ascorbate transporter 6 [Hibiscus syriacus]|uniref:Nucleobase-ascorbate transporter 6 n=1 Tax=Hibiscus syriacus TaxID=106335 RepID=A0A6A3BKX1_HIBSY|nr:nucleobase-ascorbate transporter 4-like [Hibiscus syriacus]KAE8716717.1 Nucleobase-ascorbate transporter 6 [Hibiscus syriacus]